MLENKTTLCTTTTELYTFVLKIYKTIKFITPSHATAPQKRFFTLRNHLDEIGILELCPEIFSPPVSMIKYFAATEDMSNKAKQNMTVANCPTVGIFIC